MLNKYLRYMVLILLVTTTIFATDGTKTWEFNLGDGAESTPAVGVDGTIYAQDTQGGKLYAIDSNGTKKWQFDTGAYLHSAPSIDDNGVIYIGSEDNKLFAINPDGTKRWEFATDSWVYSSPTLAKDGSIYIADGDSKLYAINPDGTQKWKYDIASDISHSKPAVGGDGVIYIGSQSGKLYAINPDGTQKWQFDAGDAIYSSPAIGSDGAIYFGCNNHKFYAIDSNGTKKWEVTFDAAFMYSSPVIGSDATIYAVSSDYSLHAINPDGTDKWDYNLGNWIDSSPVIGSDGVIYIGSTDSKLYAINPDGTKKWEFASQNAIYSTPAIANNGTLYIGSTDGKLYAIQTSSLGLANSPWPRYGHDNKNTGNISLEGRNATAKQKIAGLYIAFFNRAPDYSGLTYWDNLAKSEQAKGNSPSAVLKELARGFASHPVFTQTYGGMTNQQFVEAIYKNVLGKDGDSEGIAYWTSILDQEDPNKFPYMVSTFVEVSLTLSITQQNFPTLSQSDIEAAQERQNLLIDKVNVAINFVDKLGTKTNVADTQNPEEDPAYKASVRIISKVTSDVSTVKSATDFLDSIKSDSDSVAKILLEWGNYERLKKTGETESSYVGDDGYFQRGVDISYTDNLNGTITDNVTNLVWQDNNESNSIDFAYRWNDAVSYCENLELGGYDDWRLPSVDELLTISDKGRYKPSINPIFNYVANSTYWSSDSYENNTSYAWIVGFEYGQTTQWGLKTNRDYIRCVRGEKVPKTYTRDDYNNIVTDTQHGLMWQDDNSVKISTRTWKDAIDYCEDLNLLGYGDWHLPNFNELHSIVDLNRTDIPINSIFINTADGRYWSSTSIAEGYSDAWIVNFGNGGDSSYMDWYDEYYVRCVRYK